MKRFHSRLSVYRKILFTKGVPYGKSVSHYRHSSESWSPVLFFGDTCLLDSGFRRNDG